MLVLLAVLLAAPAPAATARPNIVFIERRLDELVAAERRDELRADVQDLKGRMDALHQRVDALERRIDRK